MESEGVSKPGLEAQGLRFRFESLCGLFSAGTCGIALFVVEVHFGYTLTLETSPKVELAHWRPCMQMGCLEGEGGSHVDSFALDM